MTSFRLCIKPGTRGRGNWDAFVGNCNSGTRDEGLKGHQVWDAGRQIQGCGGRGGRGM